jgi:hypothetical protein
MMRRHWIGASLKFRASAAERNRRPSRLKAQNCIEPCSSADSRHGTCKNTLIIHPESLTSWTQYCLWGSGTLSPESPQFDHCQHHGRPPNTCQTSSGRSVEVCHRECFRTDRSESHCPCMSTHHYLSTSSDPLSRRICSRTPGHSGTHQEPVAYTEGL